MTPEEIKAANKVADAARDKAAKEGPEAAEAMGLLWSQTEDEIREFIRAGGMWTSNEKAREIIKRARLEFLKAYLAGKLLSECAAAAKTKAGMSDA